MTTNLKRYFLSGLLVWVPVWVSILLIRFLVNTLDNILLLMPQKYHPESLIGFHIPGIGVIAVVTVIVLTGMIAANFIGRWLIHIWEKFVNRIPLIRSIYMGVKQILDTLFTPGGTSFRKVLLIEYPRPGLWTVAFLTGDAADAIKASNNQQTMICVFIPTTPNPTSGFLLMIPKEEALEVDMTVEQALKFVISFGVLQPKIPKGS